MQTTNLCSGSTQIARTQNSLLLDLEELALTLAVSRPHFLNKQTEAAGLSQTNDHKYQYSTNTARDATSDTTNEVEHCSTHPSLCCIALPGSYFRPQRVLARSRIHEIMFLACGVALAAAEPEPRLIGHTFRSPTAATHTQLLSAGTHTTAECRDTHSC